MAEAARGPTSPGPDESSPARRPTSPAVWIVRIVTGVMLLVAIVVGARKFRTTPEQEELSRYVQLTVPVYLREVADVEDRITRLDRPGLKPEEARAILVDEVTPLALRARKHATAVQADVPSVKASNEEFLAALDQLIDTARTAVRAIDDPALSGEEGHRQVKDKHRAAGEAIRAWMQHLAERCKKAGIKLVPGEAAKK